MLESGQRLRFGKISYTFQLRISQPEQRRRAPLGTTAMRELTTGFFDPAAAGLISAISYQPVLDADGALKLPGAERALPAGVVASFKESPALVVLSRGDPQVYHLKRGTHLTIGRDKKDGIAVAEIAASRKHAEVFFLAAGIGKRSPPASMSIPVTAPSSMSG
jgi:hypothetical protein